MEIYTVIEKINDAVDIYSFYNKENAKLCLNHRIEEMSERVGNDLIVNLEEENNGEVVYGNYGSISFDWEIREHDIYKGE